MITLHKLAQIVGGKVIGAPEKNIIGVSDINEGAPNTISFLFDPKKRELISQTKAAAIVVSDPGILEQKDGIVVDNPRLAMAKILKVFESNNKPKGVNAKSAVKSTAKLGENVAVGAFSVIGDNTKIGNNVIIHNNVSIGDDVEIGDESEIFSNVAIHNNVRIGKKVTIDMGTVIGSCGYGYETVDFEHIKIPQIGSVVIEDNVDIGANCTIDRGTIKNTIVGKGTKIDNLVQIAHNVKIGKGCLIAGLVGFAGSISVGDFCIFGGQVGVKDGITIGSRAIFLGKTGITKSVPGGKIYSGNPCREVKETNRRNAAYTQIKSLQKRLGALEEKIAK